MAGTIVADTIQADSTSTLVLKNGVANTPPTIQDSAGTQIGTFCRAWVNFNGTTNTGGFCTIRASFNVTSVADNGTGNYTVNFTNAMPDANYSIAQTLFAQSSSNDGGVAVIAWGTTPSTTSFNMVTDQRAAGEYDPTIVCFSVFR